MAILESIRKRSLFLILVIGMALFAFVISGVFTQGGFSATKSLIGEVNGNGINREDFARKVENLSNRYRSSVSNVQVVNQVWNNEVRVALLEQQFEKLGLSIGRDQIINIIQTNPSFTSDPRFQNELGFFDENNFVDFIASLKEENPFGYEEWKIQEQALVDGAKEQMYFNLVKAGIGTTLKEGELEYKQENNKVDIKFVKVPYTSIPDSTITVTKNDIQRYIDEHKDQFELEASADVEYVFFEEKPSVEDENTAKDDVAKLLNDHPEFDSNTNEDITVLGFVNAENNEAYVTENSDEAYQDKFLFKEQLAVSVSDTLFNLDINEVFGPYKDNGAYKISKMIEKTNVADSVKASYILVPYQGAERAFGVTRSKEEAKKMIDSIFPLVRANKEKFAEVADTINQDATRGKGGDLGWTKYSTINDATFDRDFSDFMFFNEVGSIDIVETKFGYHIIRVDDKTDFKDAVKLATVVRTVEVSDKTSNDLFTTTTKFEIESNDRDLQEVAKDNNYTVRPVNRIRAMDENFPGLGNQRSIVRWAFDKEAKIGDVKRFNVNNGYVVARLTKRTKKGIAKADDVSARVLPILRRQQKAQIIKNKSNASSLDDFAKQNGATVSVASALSMKSTTIAGAGREPKVLGTAFGMEEGAFSGLIEGENGVYMVQVTKKTDAVALDSYGAYVSTQKTTNRNRAITNAYNAIRDAANIEDNRAEFY